VNAHKVEPVALLDDGPIVSPRGPWLAAWCSMLSPASGWAYVGRPLASAVLNLFMVGLWALFAATWARLEFSPFIPFVVFGAGWTFLSGMLALDATNEARRVGEGYRLRPYNSILVYVALAIFTFWLPLSVMAKVLVEPHWRAEWVSDRGMAPTMLRGERVILDVSERATTELRRGDIVAYRPTRVRAASGSEVLHYARIVGVAGDSVTITGAAVEINGQRADWRELVGPAREAAATALGANASAAEFWIESTTDLDYVISVPATADWGQPVSWTVPEGYVVLLNDDRGNREDSRALGPIRVGDVVGKPIWIASPATAEQAWARLGRRVQAEGWSPDFVAEGSGDGSAAPSAPERPQPGAESPR
jgi:signal peptidase I